VTDRLDRGRVLILDDLSVFRQRADCCPRRRCICAPRAAVLAGGGGFTPRNAGKNPPAGDSVCLASAPDGDDHHAQFLDAKNTVVRVHDAAT
jgi:hypothetical protein